jgi:general secretion pathway protein A
MYENKFGLNKNPFTLSPDPSACYLTEFHREALAGLYYAVMRRRGFVSLVGQAGTGKTTLLRKLLASVPEDKVHSGVVFNPTLSPSEFLKFVLYRLGRRDYPTSKVQGLIQLEALLVDLNEAGKIPLLVVDEAHKLSPAVLEEIRLLGNFENNDHKLLQIVLAGQPELTTVLNRAELWQMKQRVGVRVELEPLNCRQLEEYIAHRWTYAGGTLPVPFEDSLYAQIAAASHGIPRIVNTICDNSLMVAYASGSPVVKWNHLREALTDLDISPDTLRMTGPIVASQLRKTAWAGGTAANGTVPPFPVPPGGKSDVEPIPEMPDQVKPAPGRFTLRRWIAR